LTDLFTPDRPPPTPAQLLAVTIDGTLPPPDWLQALSYSANVDRYLIEGVWPNAAGGVLNGLVVAPHAAGANMTVDVAAGVAVCHGTDATAQGSYLCRLLSTYNVGPVPAAPPAGQSRLDRVVLQVNDPAATGTGTAGWGFGIVAGTPATSNPALPPAPPSSVTLATLAIAAGTVSVGAAQITDARSQLQQLVRVLPPPLAAGAALQSYTTPDGEVWVAKGGVAGGAWQRARDVLHLSLSRAAAFNTPANAITPFGFDTVNYDAFAMFNPGTFAITLPIPGRWAFRAKLAASPAQGGWYDCGVAVFGSGAVLLHGITGVCYNAAIFTHTALAAVLAQTTPNGQVEFFHNSNALVPGVADPLNNYLSLDWLAPL
jgi:hypothetical protein